MKSLEHSQIMNIQGQDYWITASLGVIMINLLQENNLTNIK